MTGVLEAFALAMATPSITVQLDMKGARCCNCCTQQMKEEETPMIIVNETSVQPSPAPSLLFLLFSRCCKKDKDKEAEKEAVEKKAKELLRQYFASQYSQQVARQAFKDAGIEFDGDEFDRVKTITLSQARTIRDRANAYSAPRIKAKKEELQDAAKPEEEKSELDADEVLNDEQLVEQLRTISLTVTKLDFEKKGKQDTDKITSALFQKIAKEDRGTLTRKGLNRRVILQLQEAGYIVKRPKPSLPSYEKPSATPGSTPSQSINLQHVVTYV